MTTQESHRATVEARRAAGNSAAPVSGQETALRRYLSATAYESMSTAPEVLKHRSAPVAESAAAPDNASPRTAIIPAADPVIAGVDGSRCARNAARWAAVEASRRHVGLHLVHAYHLPPGGFPGYNPYPPHLLADLRDEGAAILAETAGELHRDFRTCRSTAHWSMATRRRASARLGDGVADRRRYPRREPRPGLLGVGGRGRRQDGAGSSRSDPLGITAQHGTGGCRSRRLTDQSGRDRIRLRRPRPPGRPSWSPCIAGPTRASTAPYLCTHRKSSTRSDPGRRADPAERGIRTMDDKYPDVQVEQAVIHDPPE